MTILLDNGMHVTINCHSGKVWLSPFNGRGIIIPLSERQAMDISVALTAAVVKQRKQRDKPKPA